MPGKSIKDCKPSAKGGPKTAAGKKIASRNALRHGLTAVTHRRVAHPTEIERFAKALCGGDDDPSLLEDALDVAKCEMALRAVRAQRLAVVERLREVSAIALRKGDNGLIIGRAKYMASWVLSREIELLVPKLMEKYEQQIPGNKKQEGEEPSARGKSETDNLSKEEHDSDDMTSSEYVNGLVPIQLKALLESIEAPEEKARAIDAVRQRLEERDDAEAFEEAMPDLIRLGRYEQQAYGRLLRSMRKFANSKWMLSFPKTHLH
ncbi:MAG: hypothetical protein WBE48_07120 [Xanthobacteraceae bacterium]